MKIGRNDPCPCGSGKKYKHCCLNRQPPADELLWRRQARFNREGPPAMLRLATERGGDELLEAAWREFNLWDEATEPFSFDNPQLELFLPWLLYDWVPEEADEPQLAPLGPWPIAAAWLQSRGGRAEPIERQYIAAGLGALCSFHEVTECRPGEGFTLRDLLTGRERRVTGRSASQGAEAGDILFARVVELEGLAVLDGCAPYLLDPETRPEIDALRAKIEGTGLPLDDTTLRDYDLELRDLYLAFVDDLLAPLPEELVNTGGDALEFHTLRYDIDEPEAAFDALRGLAGALPEQELLAAARRDDQGRLLAVRFPWLAFAGAEAPQSGHTVLGDVAIEGKVLTVEVNSRERADLARQLIARLLPDGAHYRTDLVESFDSVLERSQGEESISEMSGPQEQRLIAQALEGHYAQWPDEPLPALDGRTPREVLAEPGGRERVEALLAEFERDTARAMPGLERSPVDRARRELGLL